MNVDMSQSLKRPREDDDREQLTTPKTSFNNQPLSDDTPFNHNSGTHHSTTHTSALSEHSSQLKREQRNLEECLQSELENSIYDSATILDMVCPDPEKRGQKVYSTLLSQGKFTVSGESVTPLKWPSKNAPERDFYAPFVALLNAIASVYKNEWGDKSYLLKALLRFHKYDREMWEKIEGSAFLKPDILATLGLGPLKPSQKCSWHNVEIPGECKKEWPKMVKQAATYARCAFAAADNRNFIPVLALQTPHSIFRVLFFHRGGLTATKSMNLLTCSGFRSFVNAIVGILNWETPVQAGYQTGQSHSHFKIDDQVYGIERVICRRHGIRGRNTRVFELVKQSSQPQPATVLAPTDTSFEDEQGKIEANNRRPTHVDPLLRARPRPPDSSQELKTTLPDRIVLKCSHPMASRTTEEDIFSGVQGYIGIPDVLVGYDADSFPIPADAIFWNVFNRKHKHEAPLDKRKHRHLLLKTVGSPITSASSPKKLGFAILHAMIGHCTLFYERKYLHRDVSNGNILLNRQTEQRKIPHILSEIVKSKDSTSVLIDGDVAKGWDAIQDPATHRSGTKPFISARLTQLWVVQKPVTHTPMDDLESFIWVLIYTLLLKTKKKIHEEELLWEALNSDNLGDLYTTKTAVLSGTSLEPSSDGRSPFLEVFMPLITEWLKIAQEYADFFRARRSLQVVEEHARSAYTRYIKIGVQHVQGLPDVWPTES